jgi:hypothetical protein
MSTEISYTQSYHQLEKSTSSFVLVSLVMTLSLFHDYKGDSQLRIFDTSAYGYCGQLVIGEGWFQANI